MGGLDIQNGSMSSIWELDLGSIINPSNENKEGINWNQIV